MKLIESDGKRLLAGIGISVPRSVFVRSEHEWDAAQASWTGASYVKAQVLRGRRGRAGFVRKAETLSDVPAVISSIASALGACSCAGWLIEEEMPHEGEQLLAMDIDRRDGRLRLTVASEGGMDVASGASYMFSDPSDVAALPLDENLKDIARRLAEAMRANDCVSIEINPLVKRGASFVALDAKIETDETAAFRHPLWEHFTSLPAFGRERTPYEQAYDAFRKDVGHRGTFGNMIELDGDLALILSGGGASLMALDSLSRAGGEPANTCEFSGNPEREAVRKGAAILFRKPGIRGIWIAGSYANFTDICETVMGMLEAIEDAGIRVPIVIRRDGPRKDEAKREAITWASQHEIPLLFHGGDVPFDESAKELMRLVESRQPAADSR